MAEDSNPPEPPSAPGPSSAGGARGDEGDRRDDPDDLAALAAYADELADGVVAALPGWVVACVERIWSAWQGEASATQRAEVPAALRADASAAGRAAVDDVGPRVRALLALDIDEQRTNPLSIVRSAVRYPTAVLADAGVPPVVRDRMAVEQFPDDPYDLTPTRFADLDPALHDVGLRWGAAKAHVHLRRHRR